MKTILITGGSRGIGLAIAEKYLNTQEYNVVVTGRKEQTLEELSKAVSYTHLPLPTTPYV